MKLQPYAAQIQEQVGLPMMDNQQSMPEDEDDIEHFMTNYKEKTEIIIERVLKFITNKHDFFQKIIDVARHMYISGRAIFEVCYKNGEYILDPVDPREFVFDHNASDDFLSDATYFARVKYYPLADVAARYNLKENEIKEAYKKTRNTAWLYNTNDGKAYREFAGNVHYNLFDDDSSEGLKVLVIDAYWLDTTPEKYIKNEDKYGNHHIKKINPDSKKYSEKVNISTWRKASLIGGMITKDWGLVENQGVDIDNATYSYPPFVCLFPNWINKKSVSQVEQLKGLQRLKNLAMYNLQLEMNKAGTKGFVYDVSQTPDDWDHETVIKYLKTVGIAFIDSRKDGEAALYNQFSPIDQSLGSNVEKFLNIAMSLDNEMNAISGINEARQGITQGSSQAVGVTQSALLQGNLITAHRNKLFEIFTNKILTHLTRIAKMHWKDKDYSHIVGDKYNDFMESELWLELDDYAVKIFTRKAPQADFQRVDNLLLAGFQNGLIDFEDALEFSLMDDLEEIKRIIKRKRREREREQQAQAQMQMQHEQQMAQQKAEQDNQRMLAQYQGQANLSREAEAANRQTKLSHELESRKTKKELESLKAMLDSLRAKNQPDNKK